MKLTNNVKLLIKNRTMKKNFIYALVGCLAFSLAACSDDPMDATSKHVYGPEENPYLKTDLTATISTSQEFPVQRIDVAQEIKLADYADVFHAQLGMTVDEAVNAVSSGSVVFYPINVTRGQWLRNAAPTKGTHGWHFNSAGGLCDASSASYSVEFDAAKKAVVISCNSNIALGNYSFNVGFAIDNGYNFDDYVRFSNSFSVTDPSKIVLTGTFPPEDGSYNGFSINFVNHADVINVCMDMSIKEFEEALSGGLISIYMVKADGTWDTEASYSAGGYGGYWFTLDGKYTTWGNSSAYFIEMGDGDSDGNLDVKVGRYPGDVPTGTTLKLNFVIVLDSDHSKYVEFIVEGKA